MGLAQEIRQIFQSLVETQAIVYTNYPTAVAPLANVTGISAAADGAGSKYGTVVEIIAAGLIATTFWLCAINVNTCSAADQYQVAVIQGAGAGTLVWESGVMDLTAATANMVPIWLPRPVRITAGVRIGAKIACLDAVARTLNVSVVVGTGFGA